MQFKRLDMVLEVDELPHRPLTEEELTEFRAEQDIECPTAFYSFCEHCDKEGIVDALIRDGRKVYALHHGWEEWELSVLEEDMDPEMFRMMAKMMNENKDMLRASVASGRQPE